MSVSESFERSFSFFEANKERIYKDHKNKVVAVYVDRVLGEYESKSAAYLQVPKDHDIEPGSFIIQDCSQDHLAAQVYHSRVEFSKP